MMVDEALNNDLTMKLDGQSEQSRRLEENLDNALGELRSCQNDLLVANEQIEDLGSIQQYRDEQHRASLADLENKIKVACMEDDTGKVQLSVDLRESVRAFGELQGELTSKVRQLDPMQTEVKRITGSRDAVVVERERLERQVVQYQNEIQRSDETNVVVENDRRTMVFDQVNKQHDSDELIDDELKLKEIVSQLATSVRELSQKADAPDPDTSSVVAKLISEVIEAKAENASQQDVSSRKIDEMARANDGEILRYTTYPDWRPSRRSP